MRRKFLFIALTLAGACGAASVVASTAEAQGLFRKAIAKRLEEQQKKSGQPAPAGMDFAYGDDLLQHGDFWRATGEQPAPLVIFVHGGGWKRGDKSNATGAAKVTHFRASGYAIASIDYRLVPAASVEEQAADVAHAVAWLIGHARELGVDSRRVVLMGHSAGAHLAALIGTDMRYFREAGLRGDAVRGIVLLDGAAYNVPRQIAEGGNFMHETYLQAFGADVARQRALSPTLQAAAPNAPSFLILHVARADGTAQSKALATALNNAGTAAEIHGFEGTGLRGHTAINRQLGEVDYPATPVVDAYLSRVFQP